jgi:hypothetical protein
MVEEGNSGLTDAAVRHNCYRICFPRVEDKDADNEDLCSEPHSDLSGSKPRKYKGWIDFSVYFTLVLDIPVNQAQNFDVQAFLRKVTG